METENYVQMMTDSLIMKKDILEKVIVLSEAQNGILAAAEFDEKAFRENIDEKAELIDKIERLDDGFNSLFARVKETLDGHKDEYKSEITVIKELIKSVTELAVRKINSSKFISNLLTYTLSFPSQQSVFILSRDSRQSSGNPMYDNNSFSSITLILGRNILRALLISFKNFLKSISDNNVFIANTAANKSLFPYAYSFFACEVLGIFNSS